MTTTPRNMTMEADKPNTLHTQPVDIDDKQGTFMFSLQYIRDESFPLISGFPLF
jgi:hypothetical protein